MSTLSWSTRIKAFCICFVLGILLSFLGSIALFLHRGIVVFAVFYTIGNLVSMARWVDNRNISHLPANYFYISTYSTCFLMGPFKQIKKMFAETRLIATSIVIVSIVMTFVSAIAVYYDLNSFFSRLHFIFYFSFVVEKGRTDAYIHHHTVPGHDLVLAILYTLCTRCGTQHRLCLLRGLARPSWSIICTLLYIYCSNAYY